MKGRRGEDGLYTPIVLGFLVGLVVLGLLGVPALLVAAIGAAVAAVGIAILHRRLEGRGPTASRRGGGAVPEKYVPRVLQSGTVRRRTVHLRRHRRVASPLRFH